MIRGLIDQSAKIHLLNGISEQRATDCRVGLIHSDATVHFCLVKSNSGGGFLAQIFHKSFIGDQVQVEFNSGNMFNGLVIWTQDDLVWVAFQDRVDIKVALSNQSPNPDHLPRLPRIEIDCRLRLRCGNRYHRGRVCDISQSGAKVQTSGPLAPETCVTVILRDLPPISASVRWTRGTRAGISFDESVRLEPLARWIQDRRADPPGTPSPKPSTKPRLAAPDPSQERVHG